MNGGAGGVAIAQFLDRNCSIQRVVGVEAQVGVMVEVAAFWHLLEKCVELFWGSPGPDFIEPGREILGISGSGQAES